MTSLSKVIEAGWIHPPPGIFKTQKPGSNRVKYSFRCVISTISLTVLLFNSLTFKAYIVTPFSWAIIWKISCPLSWLISYVGIQKVLTLLQLESCNNWKIKLFNARQNNTKSNREKVIKNMFKDVKCWLMSGFNKKISTQWIDCLLNAMQYSIKCSLLFINFLCQCPIEDKHLVLSVSVLIHVIVLFVAIHTLCKQEVLNIFYYSLQGYIAYIWLSRPSWNISSSSFLFYCFSTSIWFFGRTVWNHISRNFGHVEGLCSHPLSCWLIVTVFMIFFFLQFHQFLAYHYCWSFIWH